MGHLFIAEAAGIGVVWHSRPAIAEGTVVPSEADIEILQGALSSVRKLGDFPSKASLADADARLTESLGRWQALKSSASPEEVSAILRRRADVRLRSGRLGGALKDLGDALEICKARRSDASVRFNEMPRVLVARAEALVTQSKWKEALSDYNFAAELLGEPLEDAGLLSGRGKVKQQSGDMTAAAEDYDAAAQVLQRLGRRAEAEIEAEHAAAALLGAGKEHLADAEDRFCGVIRRTIGLLSADIAVLQRVVIADSDARMAMTAISWHQGKVEVADTYWRDGCDRINILETEAQGKKLAIGFPNGDVYGCSRYEMGMAWLRDERNWPDDATAWLQDFLRNRPSSPPRAAYVQDVMTGRRPGEGSTLVDLAIATDVFRRSDPLGDLQANLQAR